jgi:hypothetical protein
VVLFAASQCMATGPYVRIEQDWELDLGTPDPAQPTPQVAVQIDPYPNSSTSAVLLLNYQDTPNFQSGGMQLQLWNQNVSLGTSTIAGGQTLGTSGEKITWTQYLRVSGNQLNFGISGGQFPTWGQPASDQSAVSTTTDLTSFSGYSTNDSVSKSTILLGSSAVGCLKITAVRKYDAAGNHDDESGQQVYP